jgi:hypothetical protein
LGRNDWEKVKVILKKDGSRKVMAWKYVKPLLKTGMAKLEE